MLCNICGKKKATVHLTEIIDEQMSEMHLCEDCARDKSMQMEQQFGLADLLSGLSDFDKQVKGVEKENLKCSNCGLTYDDFRKFGRLGCSQCYESFKSRLAALLKKIHGSNRHSGKSPLTFTNKEGIPTEDIDELKKRLLDAISAENFERAAELRDKIYEIENRGGN